MRKLLAICFLAAALAPQAFAQVAPIALSTPTTCVPVSVSSFTQTSMIAVVQSTNTAPSLQTILSIQNQNATAANQIYCSPDVAVSSQTANSHLGWAIPGAGASRDFTLMGTQQFYCFGGLAGSSITTEVCKTQ